MAQNHHQLHADILDGVFGASSDDIIRYIARYTEHKQITEPLVEDHFRRHARIGATEHDRERVLSGFQLKLALGSLVRVLAVVRHEALVAFHEQFQRLVGSQ